MLSMATMGSPISVLLCGGCSSSAGASGAGGSGVGESRAAHRAPPSPSDRSRSSAAAILQPGLPPPGEERGASDDAASARPARPAAEGRQRAVGRGGGRAPSRSVPGDQEGKWGKKAWPGTETPRGAAVEGGPEWYGCGGGCLELP